MKRIVFLRPFTPNPRLKNFRMRYEALSDVAAGYVLARTPVQEQTVQLGSRFCFLSLPERTGAWTYPWYAWVALRRACRDEKIDLIVSYDPLTCGIAGVVLKLWYRVPLVVEINGHYLVAPFIGKKSTLRLKLLQRVYRFAIALVLRFADAVKALNPEQLVEIRPLARLDGKPVFEFFDHTPIESFAPSQIRKSYIFTAGFPFYLKGVDLLIKAFLTIAHDFPGIELKIIGFCDDPTPYLQLIGDNRNIKILTPLPFDEMPILFSQCLFFVLPSRTEAMGRVLLEAMASGRPVLGSDVAGIRAIVKDDCGLLFESQNIEDLAEKMRVLLEDETLRETMGGRAAAYVRQTYSTSRYVEQYGQMIDHVTSLPGQSR